MEMQTLQIPSISLTHAGLIVRLPDTVGGDENVTEYRKGSHAVGLVTALISE